jgi:hypothetical protein
MLHFFVSPDDGDPPKEAAPITIPSVSLYERETEVKLQIQQNQIASQQHQLQVRQQVEDPYRKQRA